MRPEGSYVFIAGLLGRRPVENSIGNRTGAGHPVSHQTPVESPHHVTEDNHHPEVPPPAVRGGRGAQPVPARSGMYDMPLRGAVMACTGDGPAPHGHKRLAAMRWRRPAPSRG